MVKRHTPSRSPPRLRTLASSCRPALPSCLGLSQTRCTVVDIIFFCPIRFPSIGRRCHGARVIEIPSPRPLSPSLATHLRLNPPSWCPDRLPQPCRRLSRIAHCCSCCLDSCVSRASPQHRGVGKGKRGLVRPYRINTCPSAPVNLRSMNSSVLLSWMFM